MLIYATINEVLEVLSQVKDYAPKFFVENIVLHDISQKQLNFDELKIFSYYENGKTLSYESARRSIYSAIVHKSITYFQRRPIILSKLKQTLTNLSK